MSEAVDISPSNFDPVYDSFSPAFSTMYSVYQGFPDDTNGKEPACWCRRRKRCGFDPWVEKRLWRRKWQLAIVFLWRIPWTEESGGLQSIGSQSQTWLKWLSMHSEYKLNKQGDNIHAWCSPFPILKQSIVPCPVLSVSCHAYRFLRRQVRCSGIPRR